MKERARADIVIAGAGIAGASLAWMLLRRRPGLSLLLLEAELQPGYHTTGRSAAFYAETYGGPDVQPLTTASKPFFTNPPPGFADTAILGPRGALHIAHADAMAGLDALESVFAAGQVGYQRLGPEGVRQKLPQLAEPWAQAAIWEPGCADIDVAVLHQAFLGGARRQGARLALGQAAQALRPVAGGWRVETPGLEIDAGRVVIAAGAWADELAGLAGIPPLGIQPLRRTIVVTEVDPPATADMPVVMDAGGSLYFKPDAGRLWISPHDETPDVAHDVQPDEMDMAIALDRFEQMCAWRIRRLASKWAGLRNFTADRLPAMGDDPRAPGLFWFVGQGGWGIQTAPAAADIGAAMLLGEAPPMDPTLYDVARLRR